jgi:hypothetical protein
MLQIMVPRMDISVKSSQGTERQILQQMHMITLSVWSGVNIVVSNDTKTYKKVCLKLEHFVDKLHNL